MLNNFKPSLTFIRKWEGGNDDDPDDPGGRTSRGITQREFNAWCVLHNAAHSDVWACSDDTVDQIYYHQYWMPYGDALRKGLDLLFFDMCVNTGMHQATLLLQRGLKVTDDGHFGLVTMQACREHQDLPKLLKDIHARRQRFYKSLRGFRKYGKGWTRRDDECLAAALHMVGS